MRRGPGGGVYTVPDPAKRLLRNDQDLVKKLYSIGLLAHQKGLVHSQGNKHRWAREFGLHNGDYETSQEKTPHPVRTSLNVSL
jgi:hypothetical protein